MSLKPLTFAAALGGLCLMSTGGLAAEAGGGAALATAAALRDKALTDSTAYDFLSDLTTEIGSRRAGSSAEHRAAQLAVKKLTAMGFANVHIESFAVPGWTRGEEKAELVGENAQRLVIAALGGSVATPPEGIEAEVAAFATYKDMLDAPAGSLKGKIAVVLEPMVRTQDGSGYGMDYMIRGMGASEASKRGAVAYLLRSLATDESRAPHTGAMTYAPQVAQIPAAALSAIDADQITRLVARGKALRMKVVLTPHFEPGETADTVVADVIGSEKPQEMVLIGGHLDSWDLGTGAIDDGAGVATATAAAKLILDLPRHPKRTVRLVLFGAEEIGKANGAFAKVHGADQANFVIASECDFGAEPVYQVKLPNGAAQSPFGQTLSRALKPLPAFISPVAARDGGADFEDLEQTPKAELQQDGTHYFDLHHTAEDTLDKVSPQRLARLVAAWTAFTYLAAETDVDFRALEKAASAK